MGESPYPEDDVLSVPHEPETERVLLNTIILGPENPEVPEVMSLLNGGEALLVPVNKAIYLAYKSLHERQDEINLINLANECAAQGSGGKVGGFSGLMDLFTGYGDEVVHPLRLARRLHDLHLRRQLQSKAARIMRNSGNPMVPLEDLLQDLQEVSKLGTEGHEPLLSFPGLGVLLDTPAPPPQWVIPGLIPRAVPCVVASKGGLGKSFLFLQACVALATGKAFLDFPAQPPMTVLYLGLEDPRETFQARLQSIVNWWRETDEWSDQDDQALRRNMEAPVIHWRALGNAGMLASMAPYLERYLEEQNAKGTPPGMVVIDTLARVSEGDENTVQALRPILNVCFRLADLGYSTIMLHHVGKGQDGAKGKVKDRPLLADRMSTDWVRGSSAIVDNFRGVIQLTSITQEEAEGAGLDGEFARRGGLIVMGQTKTNGVRADWRLLEQDEHGRWFVPRHAMESLAKVRGQKVFTEVSKQIELLVELFEVTRFGGNPDPIAIGKKFASEAKDPSNWFRTNLRRLRNSGFIERNSYRLTLEGLAKVKDATQGDDTND